MPVDLKSKVLSAIKREPVPFFQIATATGLSVQTTSKYCHILQAEDKITIAKFGNMKMVRKK